MFLAVTVSALFASLTFSGAVVSVVEVLPESMGLVSPLISEANCAEPLLKISRSSTVSFKG